MPQRQNRQQLRSSRATLLLAVALTVAALAAAKAQEDTQQEASLSSIPQGVARLMSIDNALEQLLRPIRRQGLPWIEELSKLLLKHLNQNIQASKRRMRRSSLDDEALTAAAAAPEAAAAADSTSCPLAATPARLVDGYLSHSADLYSTYTRVYDRLTMFYQDNRAGEDVYLLPDTIMDVAARRTGSAVGDLRRRRATATATNSSSSSNDIQITYVVVSLSSGWSVQQGNCSMPQGCKNWGSKIFETNLVDADLPASVSCKQSHCWEAAECKAASGACFMRVMVLEYHPKLGYAAQSSNVVRLVPDGVRPANNGNAQRAGLAMCSPCSTMQCA